MKIKTDREQTEPTETNYLKVLLKDGSEFRISENKFGELLINKQYGSTDSNTIQIIPQVTNEIIIK